MLQKVSSPGEDACALVSLPDSSAPVCSAAEEKAFSDLYSATDNLNCVGVLTGAFNWCDSACLAAYERVAASSPKCRSSSEYTLKTLYTYALCSCKAARAYTVGKYIPVKAPAESATCNLSQVISWTNAFEFNDTYSKCEMDMRSSNNQIPVCPTSCLELFEEGVRAAPTCCEFEYAYFTMDEKSKEQLVKCLTVRGDIVTSNALLKTNSTSSSTTANIVNSNSTNSSDKEATTTTKEATTTLPTPTPTPTAASDALSATSSLAVVVSCVVLSIAYAL